MVILSLRRITILFAIFCATGLLASCTATQKNKSTISSTATIPATVATPQATTDGCDDNHSNVTAHDAMTTQQRIDQLQKDQLRAFTEKCTYSSLATVTTTAEQTVVTSKPTTRKKALTVYTVQTGENLYSIAARTNIYHEGLLWPLIYKANRDQIKDPQQIFPDQTLTITRNHSDDEKENARETARNSGIFIQQHDSQQSIPLSTR